METVETDVVGSGRARCLCRPKSTLVWHRGLDSSLGSRACTVDGVTATATGSSGASRGLAIVGATGGGKSTSSTGSWT